MRRYRNISSRELQRIGARQTWDPQHVELLPPKSELFLVRDRRRKADPDGIRTVRVLGVDGQTITTDCGSFAVATGRNVHARPGAACCGRLYLPRQ
jgi:hypothetical protein